MFQEGVTAIKKNKIESFVEAWVDLETAIQSEVNQKEKNKHCVVLLICGTKKNVTDELICKAEIETQM